MRVPVSWLTEHLDVGEEITPQDLADAFVRIGIEVDDLRELGPVTGPLVVGRVAEIEELTEFKKPVRFCRVDVGEVAEDDDEPEDDDEDEDEDESGEFDEGPHGIRTRGIICGARNFTEGDLVVVALPGAVLPGDFAIASRKTYGRISDGMICSARELGLGEDHTGILVLPPGTASPGDDAQELLALNDTVIELAPTPDRGYALSVRGLARELSNALDVPFGDPALLEVPAAEGDAWPVRVEDPEGCPRFVLRRVTGLDSTAPTPWWMRRRLMLAGDPLHLPGRRRHQLRDARARAPAARVRHQGHPGRPGGAQGEAGREADHPGRRRAHARPGRRGDRRRQRRHLAGRHHGWREHRDHAGEHGRAARGGALEPGVDQPHGTAPQAVLRGGQAVRAVHRPAAVRAEGSSWPPGCCGSTATPPSGPAAPTRARSSPTRRSGCRSTCPTRSRA